MNICSALRVATPVIEFDKIDSTNLEALRRVAAGERGPVWLLAERQTGGRGRSGRTWISAPGNLAATLLLAPGCALAELQQLSLLSGVAVHDALTRRMPNLRVGTLLLKRPNDLLADGTKLGGMLIESTTVGADTVAVIGIGVNIVSGPVLDGRATASTAHLGASPTPRAMLDVLDATMQHWLGVWQRGAGFTAIRAAWLQRAMPIGQPMTINTGAETIYGAFNGIDETGALLVDSVPPNSGDIRRFSFGDVSLLSPRHVEGSS